MIYGAHLVLFSRDAEADRAFLRDVLGLRSVDAGHGWLIFQLPAAEAAVHPQGAEDSGQRPAEAGMLGASLYLMCDDLQETMPSLEAKGVKCTEVGKERWGIKTTMRLPSGGEIGLYQPTHPTALNLKP